MWHARVREIIAEWALHMGVLKVVAKEKWEGLTVAHVRFLKCVTRRTVSAVHYC